MSNSRMVDAVNRLIANTLSTGGELYLPDVGSLYAERRKAQRISKRTVRPPYRVVSFSSQQRGVSLVDGIAAAAKVDVAKAAEIYRTWLARVRTETGLEIEGVGVLKFKNFCLDPVFDRLLNPGGYEPVTVRSRSRFDFVLWFGIFAIIGVVGFVGYWWLCERPVSMSPDCGPAVAVRTEIMADSGESGPKMVAEEPVADGSADPAGTSRNPVAGGGVVTPSADGRADDGAAGTTASDSEPGTSDAASGTSAAGPDGKTVASDSDAVRSFVSGRRYVVLGVFSTEANARRAVREATAKESAMRCGIYRFGAKFLVSPFDAVDAESCTQYIRTHAELFPGMWTHTAR